MVQRFGFRCIDPGGTRIGDGGLFRKCRGPPVRVAIVGIGFLDLPFFVESSMRFLVFLSVVCACHGNPEGPGLAGTDMELFLIHI